MDKRERELKKALSSLKRFYRPLLKKEGKRDKALLAEYSGQYGNLYEELLKTQARKYALDVPDYWDTKSMNAIEREIRKEKSKGIGMDIAITTLSVAIITLAVAIVGQFF